MKRCKECKTNPVEDGQGSVCNPCWPTVRRRRIPIEEMLARIDATLRGED